MRLVKWILVLALLSPLAAVADTPIASDNFTRANGAVGSNWTVVNGAGVTWAISSNALTVSAAGFRSGIYYNAASFPQDQYSTATVSWWVVGTMLPSVRMSTSTEYGLKCATVTSGRCTSIQLTKFSGGSFATLQTIGSLSLARPSSITLKATGSNPTVLQVFSGATQIGTDYSDSTSPITTGSPAITTNYADSGSETITYWEGGSVGNITATPTCTPSASGGPYTTPQTVTCSSTTSASTTRCTVDGTTPTSSSPVCTSIPVGVTLTLKAFAQASGSADSSVDTESYVMNIAAIPTISPALVPYFTQQTVTLTCSTSGSTGCLRTDGVDPTAPVAGTCGAGSTTYSTPFTTGTSGTTTVKALCTKAAYGNSAVQTFAYNINPADSSALITDDFSAYYDANLGADLEPQFPLEPEWTNGHWIHNYDLTTVVIGTGSLNSTHSAVDYLSTIYECTANSGHCVGEMPGYIATLSATNTSATLSNDQWSQIVYRLGAVGVCVRCSTTRGKTGYAFLVYPGGNKLFKITSGAWTQLGSTGGTGATAGQPVRLRVIGTSQTQLQGLINGIVVIDYTDASSPVLTGGPGIVASSSGSYQQLSDFSAGGVGNTTYSANTYSAPAFTDFTDAANTSSWTPKWPWLQVPNWTGSPILGWWPSRMSAYSYSGGYGIGLSDLKAGQYQIRKPIGSDQFIEATILVNPDAAGNYWMINLQQQTWIPGLINGGCATLGTLPNCADYVSYYFGSVPMTTNIAGWTVAGVCGDPAAITGKHEYNCTPFLHTTKVTLKVYPPATVPSNEVKTVMGSTVSILKADRVRAEYAGGQVRAYCKRGGSVQPAWQSAHIYSAGDLITDPAGNLQHIVTAGTSGGTIPSTWGSSWGNVVANHGVYTTDGTATWEYYGTQCPSTSWSMVYAVEDLDLLGQHGVPAVMINNGAGATLQAVYTDIKSGTVTDGGMCASLPSGCGSSQPFVNVW